MNNIMVIGSISNDFNVETKLRPRVGETVKGERFSIEFGGKGANQAVAAARLGANVKMVGTVGVDSLGISAIKNLKLNNIDVENIEQIDNKETGSAHITLKDNDNSIIYIPGANDGFNKNRIDILEKIIRQMDLVILQNEIPLSIIVKIIKVCYILKIDTIYNPAPAEFVDSEIIDMVTYLTPNESEFKSLFPNLSVEEGLKRYPSKMIITLGSNGVAYYNNKEIVKIPSYPVQVLDTTGAGDTFNGALGYAIANRAPLDSSIKFANLAAAMSIQKFGAQGGMPTIQELKESEYFEKEWNIE